MRWRSTRRSRDAQHLRLDVRQSQRGEQKQRHHVDATVQQRLEIVGDVAEGGERDPVRITLDDQIEGGGIKV